MPKISAAIRIGLGLVAFCTMLTSLAAAQGTIVGRVFDDNTDDPLPFTNLSLLGTTQGAIAREDGSFVIANVKAGTYEIQASFMGYETTKVPVTVEDLRTVEVEVRLKDASLGEVEEVVVTAERPLTDVERASTIRSVTADEIKELTIEPTLDSVVEQQAGVTRDRDRIHIRGGRSDETLYVIDGVQQRDVISGESQAASVSARSVSEVNVITGGFDAKYGQALSGIVEAKLKEGGDEYHGFFGYTTDAVIDDQNLDLMDFQIGGPVPIISDILKPLGGAGAGKLTFFMNIAADFADGYLPSIGNTSGRLNSSYTDKLFGNTFRYENFFYPRSSNQWRGLFKTAWKASKSHKFSVTLIKNLSFNQGFNDHDIADINRNSNNYPWDWSQRLANYYTVSNDRNSFSFTWNHTITTGLLQQVKITRYFTSRHQDVAGLSWLEYNTANDNSIPIELKYDYNTPYFRDVGDATSFRDRYTKNWGLDWDWTKLWRRHDFKWGLHAQYEDVQYMTLNASSVSDENYLGDEFDIFHVYPNTGALYLQDRLEFEGLIANVGVRYDYWFPGEQVTNLYDAMDRPTINEATRAEYYNDTSSLFGYRFKGHFAPRIAVSHPITEHSHLFFNYGHFSQLPAYYYVYAKSSSVSSEEFPQIGNPNLNPEIAVQYELGVGHSFTEDKAFSVVVYNKDIYDYPTSLNFTLQERETRRAEFSTYRNLDYARSRGVEVEFKKRRLRNTSWSLAYTFSSVKGKSSDPNALALIQESGGDARETALGEQFMWWNRPHKMNARFNYSTRRGEKNAIFGVPIPGDFRFNAYLLLQSGRAYTPQDINGAIVGVVNSQNGPVESSVNCTLNQGFHLVGRRFQFTFQVWNLFNYQPAVEIDPSTGEKWELGKGQLSQSPLQNPDNMSLSDQELVDAVGRPITVDPEDPRFRDLKPGSEEWQATYDMIYNEQVSFTARDHRYEIQSNINRYSDPSFVNSPRQFRVGLSTEW